MSQSPNTPAQAPNPIANPITEANPSALDELFSRDPLGLADQDIDVIVGELRRLREAKDSGQPMTKAKAPKAKVTLADLGLE